MGKQNVQAEKVYNIGDIRMRSPLVKNTDIDG